MIKKPAPNNNTVSAVLSDEAYGSLIRLSDRHGKTVSYVVRDAILYVLETNRKPADRKQIRKRTLAKYARAALRKENTQ
jgi:hypothetical protein